MRDYHGKAAPRNRSGRQPKRITIPRKGKCMCCCDTNTGIGNIGQCGYGDNACCSGGYDCMQHQERSTCDWADTYGCGWTDTESGNRAKSGRKNKMKRGGRTRPTLKRGRKNKMRGGGRTRPKPWSPERKNGGRVKPRRMKPGGRTRPVSRGRGVKPVGRRGPSTGAQTPGGFKSCGSINTQFECNQCGCEWIVESFVDENCYGAMGNPDVPSTCTWGSNIQMKRGGRTRSVARGRGRKPASRRKMAQGGRTKGRGRTKPAPRGRGRKFHSGGPGSGVHYQPHHQSFSPDAQCNGLYVIGGQCSTTAGCKICMSDHTAYCEAEQNLCEGDLTGDNRFNVSDVTAQVNRIVESDPYTPHTDVTAYGQNDVMDIVHNINTHITGPNAQRSAKQAMNTGLQRGKGRSKPSGRMKRGGRTGRTRPKPVARARGRGRRRAVHPSKLKPNTFHYGGGISDPHTHPPCYCKEIMGVGVCYGTPGCVSNQMGGNCTPGSDHHCEDTNSGGEGTNAVCNTGLGPCLSGNCTDHEYELYCCYFNCGGSYCNQWYALGNSCPAGPTPFAAGNTKPRRLPPIAPKGRGRVMAHGGSTQNPNQRCSAGFTLAADGSCIQG